MTIKPDDETTVARNHPALDSAGSASGGVALGTTTMRNPASDKTSRT
jgi:hypothetical protein